MAVEPSAASGSVEQIVVVDHKDGRSVRDVAGNVTALSREDLENELETSLADVFRYVPGVDTEVAGTRFGTESINIRGIGGNRVAILVDGVPISDQFDIGSFSNATRDFIDTGLIRDIEVLHGPASALYGSSAIGGVVAIRTLDPDDFLGSHGLAGSVSFTWRGADESLRRQAIMALGDRSLGLIVGATHTAAEQIKAAGLATAPDQRDQESRTELAKVVIDDRLGNTWRALMIHRQSAVQSDLKSRLGTGRYRSTTALAGDDSYCMDLANVSYDFDVSRGPFDEGVLRTFVARADIRQFTLDERADAATPVSIHRSFVFEQDSQGVDLNVWKDFIGNKASHRIGYGLEYRSRQTEELRDGQQTSMDTGELTKTILGEVFPLRDFPVSQTVETGIYVEDTMSAGAWTAIAAVRADRFELRPRPDDIYAADNPSSTPVPLDESDISPKLGLIREISPHFDVYLQYAHGFRAPPYSDANIGLDIPTFNIRAIPNPDLRSESSNSFEAGMRILKPNLDLHLDVFHSRYTDFIESKVRVGVDPESGRLLFQSRNISKMTIKGIEAALAWRFGGERRAFELDASAYYAAGKNDHNGQPVNSVGPAQATFGLGWVSPGERQQLQLRAILTGRWGRRDDSLGELFEPPGYGVVDFYYVRRFGTHAAIRTGLHNLADRIYWHWTDVRGLAPDDPVLPSLARAGRSFLVNVDISW